MDLQYIYVFEKYKKIFFMLNYKFELISIKDITFAALKTYERNM